jgi:HEAT repeat protein
MMTLGKVFALVLAASTVASAQQQMRFEDVVRNLRNPDPKARLAAVQLLRDAKYPEAIAPMAALVVDPMDDIQLEAIAAELGFFLDQDVRTKKMVGFVIEKRVSGIAAAAFDLGPLAVWPRAVPRELVDSLLQAIDDENAKVRLEAIYAFGVIARPPLSPEQHARLAKALDHYDPAIRSGAARVIARQRFQGLGDTLLKAVNDSNAEVRYAAMRALGAVRDERAVQALTEQLAYYRKGEGAWSALDGLAHIGSPASVPAFKERLTDKDPFIRRAAAEGLGRAGDTSAVGTLEGMVTTDDSPMVRLASAFAMEKLAGNYTGRIVDLMSEKVAAQAQEYLVELGPPAAPAIAPRLQDPDPVIRQALADVLGAIGSAETLPALEAAAKDSNAAVAAAARRAIARIRPAAHAGH